jgi:hypothetical protein
MYMLQHDQVFSKAAVAKQSIEACGNIFEEKSLFDTRKKNIQRREKFFWTKHQRKLIEGDPKRVLFTSNYGTGKTLVMKAKATQLGRKRQLFLIKNQTYQDNSVGLEKTLMQAKPMELKHIRDLSNDSNLENLADPGTSFIILFAKTDALLFNSTLQYFENLKEHVQVVCFQGWLSYIDMSHFYNNLSKHIVQ